MVFSFEHAEEDKKIPNNNNAIKNFKILNTPVK